MGKLRSFLLRLSAYRLALAIGAAMALWHLSLGGRLDDVPVVGRLEQIFHDLRFHERGPTKPSGDVVIAAVDEKAIATLGRWPFPRTDVAQLVDRLTEMGARAIVFDVIYSDEAFEGRFAAARRLQSRFSDISLASGDAKDLLGRVELARTDASGALEAARALEERSVAARDVKARLEPVAGTLELAAKVLDRYRQLHVEYEAALAQEGGARSPDEQLAESVRRSGRVVLGGFLMDPSESRLLSAEELAKHRHTARHMGLRPPTVQPVDLDAFIKQERDVEGTPLFLTYSGVKAPLPKLVRRDADDPQPVSVAFFNTKPDSDGVIRREPLVMVAGAPDEDGRSFIVPGIDLAAVLMHADAIPDDVRLWSTTGNANGLEHVAFLPKAKKPDAELPRGSDFTAIPVDAQGRLLLNYYGPDGTFENISVGDLATGLVPKEKIEGKIVLFGVTATGTFDQRVTPFDRISPGVEIHATAMENILHGEYLRRPWWALPLELALLLFIAIVVGRVLSSTRVLVGIPIALAAMGAYHLLDYALFRNGVAIFSSLPLFEIGAIFVGQTVFRYSTEEREKREIRRAFQFYLTKSVMEEMLKDPSKLKLGGEKKVLSVMFSDIRGFTTISERLSPEQLAKLINEYLTPMTNLVFEHGGTLDKYIGDAVMAIYGAPVAQEDHAYRCCRTAVAMMRELGRLQERWRMEGRDYPPIDIGIGINSGPMVVGNMGADQRFDYTVLGDNVNLASRLEGTNKDYRSHIIVSENTYALCRERVAVRELGAVRVKGKREPVKIYELLDDRPATGELAEVIRRFDAGVAAFRAQRWAEAKAAFRSVQELWPHDGPPQAYLEFCEEYEAHPPGEGWDGVYTMTHK